MEKEANLNFKTSADTSGIAEVKEALNDLRSQDSEASMLDNDLKSADELASKYVELKEKFKELESAGDSKGKMALLKDFKVLHSELDKLGYKINKTTGDLQKIRIPNMAESAGSIDNVTQSVSDLTAGSGNLAMQTTKVHGGMKNMGSGALQAAYFFDDLQYGMKGIMNNIPGLVMGLGGGMGLAGALSVALLAGVKLYEWASDTKAEEEKAKKIKEVAEAAQELSKSLGKTIDGLKTDRIIGESVKEAEKLLEAYKKATGEIDKQISLLHKKSAIEKGIWDARMEEEMAILESKLIKGEITQRDYDIQKNQIDYTSKERQLENEKAIALATDKSKKDKANEAEKTRRKMDDQYSKDWGEIDDVDLESYVEATRQLQVYRNEMLSVYEDQDAWEKDKEDQTSIFAITAHMAGSNWDEAMERIRLYKEGKSDNASDKDMSDQYDKVIKAEEVLARLKKREENIRTDRLDPAAEVTRGLDFKLYEKGLLPTNATPEERAAKAAEVLAARDEAKRKVDQAKKEEEEAKKDSKESNKSLVRELKMIDAKKSAAAAVLDTAEVKSLDEANKKAKEDEKKALEDQVKAEEEIANKKKEEADLAKKHLAELKKKNKTTQDDAKSRFDEMARQLKGDPITGSVLKNENSVAAKAIRETIQKVGDGQITQEENQELTSLVKELANTYKGTSENAIYEKILEGMQNIVGATKETSKNEAKVNARLDALMAEYKKMQTTIKGLRSKAKG